MSGVLKIEIIESADTLLKLLQQQHKATQRSKVQLLWWLKTGQATGVSQLTHLSGYHRTTISRWLSKYRQGGIDALLEVRSSTGRPQIITGEVRQELMRELEDPEGFSSYKQVQQWLAAVWGMQVPYKTVHKTVRYGLKAKLKGPRPVSEKQQAGAVEAFKQTLA